MLVQKEETLLFNAQYYNQEKFLDIATKRKINKHLSDINDTITEDDIKNVKTDIGIGLSSFETTAKLRR
jgi:hypothetical protein